MVDGDMLRNSPSFAYDHVPPLVAPIDVLLGCNSDEGMSQALGGQVDIDNTDEFAYALTLEFGFNSTMLAEVLALWPEDAQYPPYSEPMSIDWPALTATVSQSLNLGTLSRALGVSLISALERRALLKHYLNS